MTLYDPHPKRKVNARIVGSTKITLGEEEIWRSEDDLRLVYREVMEMDLPIVNTVVTKITYSGYEDYPGWPFHLNDKWTYEELYDTDTHMQPGWTDRLRAEVVADDAAVVIEGVEYQCFKVVHTLIDTTNGTPPGNGVGATSIEYWYKDRKSIGPIKIEGNINFRGTETQTMMGTTTPPFLH